jgi:hypothetical protein
MSILDFFSSAAGGSLFGPIVSGLGKFVHAKWIRPAEVKAEIDLLTAQRNAKADAAGWDAFAASQKADKGLDDIPAGTWPWAASLYVLSDAFTRFVRPFLTATGLPLAAWVYWTLSNPNATAAQLEMAKEINFMVFMMWSWWFGERYIAKSRSPISLVPPAK